MEDRERITGAPSGRALNLFRALVICSITVQLVGIVISLTAERFVSADWRTLLEWNGDGAIWNGLPEEQPSTLGDWLIWGFSLSYIARLGALMVLAIIVQVGLLFFSPWARPGFAVVTALMVLVQPCLGLSVFLPIESMLYYLASLCDGAVLAMSYLPPIGYRFRRSVSACG